MILGDENTAGLKPYKVESFDGETISPEGQLVPLDAGARFDAALTPDEAEPEDDGFETETPDVEAASGDTDFASIKFQRENTLLTNAERYADSIRSEAEIYVRQLQGEIDSLNAEAEQRYEEARKVKEEAEEEARQRIAEADQRVEEIRDQAHGEGFEEGRRQGLEKRYEEAGVYLERLESILEDLSHFREQVNHFMERDGVRMAVLIAKKILHQELKVNKRVVWKLLAATLATMEGKGNFRIWLSQEDYRFATAARPALERFTDEDQTLSFRSRSTLPPGNAMIETDREVIDLSFASQFHHVEALLYQTLAEHEGSLLTRPSALRPPGWTEEQEREAAQAAEEAAQEPPEEEAEAAAAEDTPEAGTEELQNTEETQEQQAQAAPEVSGEFTVPTELAPEEAAALAALEQRMREEAETAPVTIEEPPEAQQAGPSAPSEPADG